MTFCCGFYWVLGNSKLDEINKSFIDKPFDWEKIRKNCKNFYVFHSDNDPYVPLKEGKKLGVDLIIILNAGHFNAKAGYTKFEMLLEKVRTVII